MKIIMEAMVEVAGATPPTDKAIPPPLAALRQAATAKPSPLGMALLIHRNKVHEIKKNQ